MDAGLRRHDGLISASLIRHSREGGNPVAGNANTRWIPAFKGMTWLQVSAICLCLRFPLPVTDTLRHRRRRVIDSLPLVCEYY